MIPRIQTMCNGKAHIVTIGRTSYYFSYTTCIAISGEEGREYTEVRVHNSWGPTTGRHFNEMGCKNFREVSDEQFEAIAQRLGNPLPLKAVASVLQISPM